MRLRTLLLCWLGLYCFLGIASAQPPVIIDKPILWNDYREELMTEYARAHYGMDITRITPRAVVVHWTAGPTWESAFWTFYHEAMSDGTLNVASHFIVDRDGTIYRLTEETALNRHIIGYNWCAIGIENVGGVGGAEDLTEAELAANVELIHYLRQKYPTIEYVFGHYQQDIARESGLYLEKVADYYAFKTDPGAYFMGRLRTALVAEGLKFWPE
ncbi:MAG: N-acetylmuramoyl-L-alanine amidase [Selenomonadaceae bacterium]|nr:N-acetylmuramoyl-L-alanine amidase [Selenomonadaceae bacterium]